MDKLPVSIPVIFGLTVFITYFFLARSIRLTRPVSIILVFWLFLQGLISLTGFYTVATGIPPRFVLLLIPPVIFIVVLFLGRRGWILVSSPDPGMLTLIHIVRIPVEIILYLLMLHKAVPEAMTFEGRNFDILCGISAPLIYYFGYVRKKIGRYGLVVWNIAGLLLLANIVTVAILSAPFRFQHLGFEQPNVALFYFPFVWLPCFVVPVALFSHITVLWRLLAGNR